MATPLVLNNVINELMVYVQMAIWNVNIDMISLSGVSFTLKQPGRHMTYSRLANISTYSPCNLDIKVNKSMIELKDITI